ncbi:MAG: transglutaminase-like domain-containing protein [Dehalococcoidia bacterium]
MDHATAIERFERLAELSGDDVDLAAGALLIAAAFDHDVDVEHELRVLDALAAGVRDRMPLEGSHLASVNVLNDYLFDEIGFAGNEAHYYDPRNSLLHEVLARRLGIPITLSLVYIETGCRLGIPLQGVGMPGHFLVRHVEEDSLYIDPFYRGIMLSEVECAERLRKITGNIRWDRSFLHPINNRSFLARILRNLSAIWVKEEALDDAVLTLGMLIALQPGEPGHRRDRGMLRYRLGEHDNALHDLETYLENDVAAPDAWYVRRLTEEIRGKR